MPKKLVDSEMNPSEIYPDPLGRAKGAAIHSPAVDIALAGDIPVSRMFSDLPAAMAKNVREDTRRERQEDRRPASKG